MNSVILELQENPRSHQQTQLERMLLIFEQNGELGTKLNDLGRVLQAGRWNRQTVRNRIHTLNKKFDDLPNNLRSKIINDPRYLIVPKNSQE